MPALGPALHHPHRNVRLDTLVRLRWLAIIGQTTAVLPAGSPGYNAIATWISTGCSTP